MKKYPLIGVSIAISCLIVLASFTNVVGVKTIEPSDNKVITDEIDQKDLLFQTIVDLANNKEIQSIIQNSDVKENFEKSLKTLGAKLLMFELRLRCFMILPPPQTLTKNYLEYAYKISVKRLKNFDMSRTAPIFETLQVNNQEMQKKITAVIEKDAKLKGEILQLSNLQCDCKNENTTQWSFPVLCTLLFPLYFFGLILAVGHPHISILFEIMLNIGVKLDCFWYLY